MGIEVSLLGAVKRRVDLQGRLWRASETAVQRVGKEATAKQLHYELRSYLIKAGDLGLLVEGQRAVHHQLVLAGPDAAGCFDIAVGTKRNFRRSKDEPHFSRKDGGWFDFQLVVRETRHHLEILAYDFELRLPPGSGFDFIRFDLNPTGHANQDDGLRSHMHLSADDDGLVAPAPVMSPFEILDLFVFGLARVGRVRQAPPRPTTQ